ncbi:MAG: FtsW/RodA/SpoVE family cell cycle protein [Bacteroidales bacterium]|nr:FtsW/RodA/SpoVE family cell cycle protein [Bacteroidales bacterium]
MAAKKQSIFKTWIDGIQGDKVMIIILILLYVISALALFSAQSGDLGVIQGKTDRLELFIKHLKMMGVCSVVVFLCYLPGVRFFRFFSQFGFAVSAFMLAILLVKPKIPGVIAVPVINDATRYFTLFGFQVHVFEITKVAMVLYLAWALQTLKDHDFKWANALADKYEALKFLALPIWQAIIYILLPISLVCVGILSGSFTSFALIGTVMVATVFLGGLDWKLLLSYFGLMAVLLLCGFGIYKMSGEKAFSKIYDRVNRVMADRIGSFFNKDDDGETLDLAEQILSEKDINKRNAIIDDNIQKEASLIAVHEGGFFGKGPGRSTQKYRLPLPFSDYMYAFLIEEYGVLMALLILILYLSLFARGIMLTYKCKNLYAKALVGGLSLLISGQAMLHILINVNLLPVTGQPLPIISYGNGSMIMFSVAFGILISISKQVKKQMDKLMKENENKPLFVQVSGDPISERLSELDQIEEIDD